MQRLQEISSAGRADWVEPSTNGQRVLSIVQAVYKEAEAAAERGIPMVGYFFAIPPTVPSFDFQAAVCAALTGEGFQVTPYTHTDDVTGAETGFAFVVVTWDREEAETELAPVAEPL
jgi:hypothetical protein